MDADFFQKRISQMKQEVFPLDRLLPLETVYAIWSEEYAKESDKNIFFRDRKFQRLREGYFGMFVVASLSDALKRTHYMIFPGIPDNDLNIGYQLEEEKLGIFEFDVKEFTDYSSSFEDFVEKSIAPRIGVYNVVIATYRQIGQKDGEFLVEVLKEKGGSQTQIWLLSAATEGDGDPDVGKVTIAGQKGIAYDTVLNLTDWLDKTKPPVVFQDTLRIKYPPSFGH
jgi:hypothetical protein